MSYIRSEISNLFKIAHLKFERKKIFQEKTDFRCTFEVIILYDIGQKSTVLNNVHAVREMEQNLCGKKRISVDDSFRRPLLTNVL